MQSLAQFSPRPSSCFYAFFRATENDPCLVLHCDYPIRNQLYSLELSALGKDDQRVNKICVPVLPEFNVVGSCKGLLYLCDSSAKDIVYVYNPFTRDCIELPKSTELLHQYPVGGSNSHSRQLYLEKFGRLPHRLIHQGPSQVLVCGRIHWHTWSGVRSSCPIISFDFEDEQFREVPKPDCGGLDHRPNIQLVDLGGCLSAVVYNNYREFEIWIMKEYNVKESWIKEFNIGNHVPTSLEAVDWISAQPYKDSKLYGKSSFVCVLGLLKTGDGLV
ncbi:hypothetical protein LWI28_013082 [Acer negundo]|uniref:F-box associated beta-propeller type 1 domain-containing protein n=1 Tax=Acer negundo TaxID=4023 RepID=A0AAD5IZT5_ACENE|nr:hypothetical protein LWI28_013082 [Acer negundo]